jgi:uncharacterized membrane protein YphA (DoxX/SURF4 family)
MTTQGTAVLAAVTTFFAGFWFSDYWFHVQAGGKTLPIGPSDWTELLFVGGLLVFAILAIRLQP